MRKMCEVDPRLAYANVVTPMLGGVGKPLPELFVKDQLHLSEKGYVIWAKVLRETLPALR